MPDISCSAHIRTREQTYDDQRSKLVTVASFCNPMYDFDGLYSVPYTRLQTLENKLVKLSATE
jgi:hypothetical protein